MQKIFLLITTACIFISVISCNNANNTTNTGDSSAKVADTLVRDAANGWALLGFNKIDSANPVMGPGNNSFVDPVTNKEVFWEKRDVYNPAIVKRNDTIFMLYRAQDSAGTSRVGLAYSKDGLHFTRYTAPVLYPEDDAYKKYEWPGGCEDPRVTQDSFGIYYMTYTSYDGSLARLCVATSPDLIHWKKHGNVFAHAYHGKYADSWAKSGSIVSTYTDGKIVATKVNGKYWMYWGDQNIWAATSDDLIHWLPVEMSKEERSPISLRGQAMNMPLLKIVVPTRTGKFDSDLVESGPPAMLTAQGILLLYNSRNIPAIGDASLAEGTYTAGQVLIDQNDPLKVIKRLDNYFLKPDKPYEITGQVNNVCFIEGLTRLDNKWFLYYGTADSKIAVAVSNDNIQ